MADERSFDRAGHELAESDDGGEVVRPTAPTGEPTEVFEGAVGADDLRWMAEALAMAEHGLSAGELPVGAVVVAGGQVVGRAFTQERTQGRLLVHAELLALDQADRTHAVTRVGTVLYTTLEPCLMCLGAAATAMVDRVVYALPSPGDGAADLAHVWGVNRDVVTGPAHVRLPPVVGGVGYMAARDLFIRFRDGRPGEGDPLWQWANGLLTPPQPRDAIDADPAAFEDAPDEEPERVAPHLPADPPVP